MAIAEVLGGEVGLFLRGLVVGVAVAMPVGPIALLVMKRTLEKGRGFGMATGLGASGADVICGTIAGFGIGLIAAMVEDWQNEFRLFGGLFMLVLGLHTFLSRPRPVLPKDRNLAGYLGAFSSGLVLTLSNPLTILGFIGVFAAFGLGGSLNAPGSIGILVAGIFLGSAAWWLSLAQAISRLHHFLSETGLRRMNLAAASGLILFGVYALVTAAAGYAGYGDILP